MVLVDTSVWVAHFRNEDPLLVSLLEEEEVLCHPFIIGELACGNLPNRNTVLSLLQALPQAVVAGQEEALRFLEIHSLMGIGLGFVDIHLLASSFLTEAPIWTQDLTLKKTADRLSFSKRTL